MELFLDLLIVVLFVIMAYYVDKFMGLGMFKRKMSLNFIHMAGGVLKNDLFNGMKIAHESLYM